MGKQTTLNEIEQVIGWVPEFFGPAIHEPTVVQSLWIGARLAYLESPLPEQFRCRHCLLVARTFQSSYAMVAASCRLRHLGDSAAEILAMLQMPLPSQKRIVEQLQVSRGWSSRHTLDGCPDDLMPWILAAAARMTLRRDPGDKCRDALRALVEPPLFNQILLLGSYLSSVRLWLDAHPELTGESDPGIVRYKAVLLEESPEIADAWRNAAQRNGALAVSSKARRLMDRIARHDRIRKALGASERRFRRVVQGMPFPAMVYDEHGRVITLNRAWIEQSGWDLAQTPTIARWFELGQRGEQQWEPKDVVALYGWDEVVEEGEQSVYTAAGQVRTWDFYTSHVGKFADGRHAIMRLAVDVTERTRLSGILWDNNKKMVNLLENGAGDCRDPFGFKGCHIVLDAIVDRLPVGIMIQDVRGAVTHWNSAAQGLLGWRAEDLLNRPGRLIPPEMRGHYDEQRQRVSRGESVSDPCVPCMAADGGQRNLRVEVIPVMNQQGRITAIVSLLQAVDDE